MLGGREAARAVERFRDLSPDFERYVMEFLSGEIWRRRGLDLRTRSLCTVAALAALGRSRGLGLNIRMALRNGASESEIREVLIQVAAYAGFPAAWEGLAVAREVFDGAQRKGRPPRRRRARGSSH